MDPSFIQDIYNENVGKTHKELEQIIEEINEQETQFLDKEAELSQIVNEKEQAQQKLQELEAKQAHKQTEKRKDKIEELHQAIIQLIDYQKTTEEELKASERERRELLDIKYVLENFVLQGIPPPKRATKINQKQTASLVNPLFEVKTKKQ